MKKEELTSRERVRMALDHKEADRVPRDLGGTVVSTITLGAYDALIKHLAETEGYEVKTKQMAWANRWGGTIRPPEELLQRLKIDTRSIFARPPRYWRDMWYMDNAYFVDEWGILRKRSSESKYHYYDVVGNPLSDATSIDDLERFRWPSGTDPGRVAGLREEAEHLYKNTQYGLVANLFGTDIFELCWFLRGFDTFLMDVVANKEFAHHLLRKITDIQLQKFELFVDAVADYVDAILLYDDLATQDSLFISPDTYREMLKPYQKEMIDLIKRKTPAKLLYHTDGAVRPLIPDLIEIGIDILQPVQVSATGMDSSSLKADFGDKVTFWGGMDNQHVIPYGTANDVRAEVEKRIRDFAPGGGYVFAAGHNIQFDVPPDNVVVLFDHAYEVGWYI
jgi:uroporphyrinogen decarboxylase